MRGDNCERVRVRSGAVIVTRQELFGYVAIGGCPYVYVVWCTLKLFRKLAMCAATQSENTEVFPQTTRDEKFKYDNPRQEDKR